MQTVREGQAVDGPGPARHVSVRSLDPQLFWIGIALLVVVAVVGPLVVGRWSDLNPRTPENIARDSLYTKYGLVGLTAKKTFLPPYSYADTISTFGAAPGATTHDVPFGRHGKKVLCTVHMPGDDPHGITARCRPAKG